MKKIFMSILAIALTVSAVSGTAYALFTDTVTIQGITMTAGNADFTIDGFNNLIDGNNLPTGTTTNPLKFEGLFPGFTNYGTFIFKNISTSDIKLSFKAQLISASGDWGYLKDAIQLAIVSLDGSTSTGWKTLTEWNAGQISFGKPLSKTNGDVTYKVLVQVPTTIGNDIAGKSLTGVKFVVTGTQIN